MSSDEGSVEIIARLTPAILRALHALEFTSRHISPATLRICGIQFGRLETLRLAFFEIAGQPMSIKSAVSRIAGHDRSKDLYRRRGYCQSIRQIGQKP